MANRIYTRGLVLCLSIISCCGFLDDNFGKEDKLGSFGCSGLTAPTNGVKVRTTPARAAVQYLVTRDLTGLENLIILGMSQGPLSADSFSRSKNLTSNYHLNWNFNSTHILLQARVKILGWIGLGISTQRNMFPSDLMIAWVDDSQVTHFTDRHVEARIRPSVDDHQDWFLVSGEESDGYTTITALRPLDPCDEQDMPIKSGDNWVIFAFSKEEPFEPEEGEDIYYHGLNRGVEAIDLLGD